MLNDKWKAVLEEMEREAEKIVEYKDVMEKIELKFQTNTLSDRDLAVYEKLSQWLEKELSEIMVDTDDFM